MKVNHTPNIPDASLHHPIESPKDVSALEQSAQRESYLDTTLDLRDYAGQVKHFNSVKEAIRDQLKTFRNLQSDLAPLTGGDVQIRPTIHELLPAAPTLSHATDPAPADPASASDDLSADQLIALFLKLNFNDARSSLADIEMDPLDVQPIQTNSMEANQESLSRFKVDLYVAELKLKLNDSDE